MRLRVEIKCVEKDNKGVIIKINAEYSGDDSGSTFNEDGVKKDDFIEMVREIEKEGIVNIRTSDGTEVHIVNDEYLRTDGDQNKHNDLLDIKDC